MDNRHIAKEHIPKSGMNVLHYSLRTLLQNTIIILV